MTFEELKLYTKNPGTYRITAIFDGDDTYAPGETVFILIVSEDPDVEPVLIPLPDEDPDNPQVKVVPELAFIPDTVTLVEDIKTNLYDLLMPYNPSHLPLTWTCNDDNVLFDMVRNKIAVPNIGEYTITASFEGNDDYFPATASYTFRLTDDEGNTVRTQRNYHLYFKEETQSWYENDDMTFGLQLPSSQRFDNDGIPHDIMELCHYTIGEDETPITGNSVAISGVGSYTIYLHFEGNEDWLPQTISYVLEVKEKDNPEISFSEPTVTMTKNNEGKYILQALTNPYNLPVKWYASNNTSWITLSPEHNACYISNVGKYTICAWFAGNSQYKPQTASYEIILMGEAQEPSLYFEFPYYEWETQLDIGSGYSVTNVTLVNPYDLPVTYSTSTPDAVVSEDGKFITFFGSVKSGIVEARFAGNEFWPDEIVASFNFKFIAWANRPVPELYFDNEEETPPAREEGVYTLQRVHNTYDVPVTWSVDRYSSGWRIEEDGDDHYLYVDTWDWYVIVVQFDGNEDWAPTQAIYTLKPQRVELQLWFDESPQYYYDYDPMFQVSMPIQVCHSTIGDDLPLHFSSSRPRICWPDESDHTLQIRAIGETMIRADFYGDNRYDSTHAEYKVIVTSEANPQIVKQDVTITFADSDVNAVLVETNQYALQIPTILPAEANIDPSWLEWSCDNASIAYPYVFAPLGVGQYTITCRYRGNQYYNPAEAHYTLYITESTIEKQDIEMTFYSPEVRYPEPREDNTYDWEPRVYWRFAGSDDEWQLCDFDLVWTCRDSNGNLVDAQFTYDTSVDPQPIIVMDVDSGIYTVTATFAGNSVLNGNSASYTINIGNVVIEPQESGLEFEYMRLNINENYPENLYPFKMNLKNPNNIPEQELVWSISSDNNNVVEIRGEYIYIYNIAYDVTITLTFAGNATYSPKTISYTMHIVPEQITKKDVVITFGQNLLNWNYNDYYQVETTPQTPTITCDGETISLPILWSIDNGAQMRGTTIYEDRVSETIAVETQNPKIYLSNVGTYTVTATFVGDRYHNSASASYTINLNYNIASVYFEENIQTFIYDPDNINHLPYPDGYIYQIQTVTKPNDIQVTYKLYANGEYWNELDQEFGCDNIELAPTARPGSYADWEVRAYYTDYDHVEKYASYILRLIKPKNVVTLTFASNTDTLDEDYANKLYRILPLTVSPEVSPIVYTISGEGNEVRNGQLYIVNPGTYTVTATFAGDAENEAAEASYNVTIVEHVDYINEYLTFESLADNNTITFDYHGPSNDHYSIDNDRLIIEYSIDKVNWYVFGNGVTLNTGQKLYVRGLNNYYSTVFTSLTIRDSWWYSFGSRDKVNLSGNIMSLIYKEHFVGNTTLPYEGEFNQLFSSLKVVDASNLILPATTLTNYCYSQMFEGCIYLTSAPTLPAKTLLTGSYYRMFYDCVRLNNITMLATDINSHRSFIDWVVGVANQGTFIKDASATIPTGTSGIPDGWTVQNV